LQTKQVKVDSKGRISIPAEFRDSVGNVVTLRRTDEGIVIAPAEASTLEQYFRRVISSEPERTGKPENWPAAKMKRIWK